MTSFSKQRPRYKDFVVKRKNRAQQQVFDSELGELVFPKEDTVMAPFISRDGIWEKEEVNWLKEHVTRGSVCLNIGSNVGYFALQMAKLTGPQGFVYAVEPNRDVLPFLEINVKNSGYKNIEVIKKAAGDKKGIKKLYLNRVNFGDSRMFDPRSTLGGGNHLEMGFRNKPSDRFVRVIKIDDVLKGKKIDIVLIDAQGFDHLVIRGMREIISHFKPKILTEFTPQWIRDMGWNPIEVLEDYTNHGYKITSLDFDPTLPITPEKLLSDMKQSKKLYTNLSLLSEINL